MLHIAVAGNIGAGKTTLAARLAKHYAWEACFESVDDNPYLKDFYMDMPRWSFHLQIYFLNSRFKQVLRVKKNPMPTIQDRTIYEDAYVFAHNLRESNLMSERDFENYQDVFKAMIQFIEPPDLLIYLRADLPKLKNQIQQRGRSFEQNIPDEYLLNLNKHYENWVQNHYEGKILIVDINEKDLLNQPNEWQNLLAKIDSHLGVKV
jgi:deoxyadenosine/deoxycytidine kinase